MPGTSPHSTGRTPPELARLKAILENDLTTPGEAERFVKETGVDLLAPAVGNVHGKFENAPEPALNILRIADIRHVVHAPLVLHGASGNTEEEIEHAIRAGISIVHISTELRVAWRKGMEEAFKKNPDEVAPYKLTPLALEDMERVVERWLKLFNGM